MGESFEGSTLSLGSGGFLAVNILVLRKVQTIGKPPGRGPGFNFKPDFSSKA
jgi:hypothetical protein